MSKERLTGVVLCGGNSSRMGEDKGLIKQAMPEIITDTCRPARQAHRSTINPAANSQQYNLLKNSMITWAERTFQQLDHLGIPVCLSINEKQREAYGELFPPEYLVMDTENPLKGPAKGIMSVHEHFPDRDLLVLACDLPYMQESTLQHLCLEYRDHRSAYDFFVYRNNGLTEPLCGIYSAAGLAHIRQLALAGKLERYSLQYLLTQQKTYLIPLPKALQEQFRNCNAPGDLSGGRSSK